MRIPPAVITVLIIGVWSSVAIAGTQDMAVIGLHAQPHPEEGGDPCTWDGATCPDFNVDSNPVGAAYDLYLIVAMGDPAPGVGALSCGIQYGPNIQMIGWTSCASGVELLSDGGNGVWPASLGGIRMTWDYATDCQRTVYSTHGVHALAGSFYVFAYDRDLFEVTPNNNVIPNWPEYEVGDCTGALSAITAKFPWVGFGQYVNGCNPCLPGICVKPVAVQATTWGGIKTRY